MNRYIYAINCILQLSSDDTEILYISEKTGMSYLQESCVVNIDIQNMSIQNFCPDVILHDGQRNQIVFVNFSDIGGVFTEEKVKAVEESIFCPGLEAAFISAFPTTAEALKEYHRMAGNTNVWVADSPRHTMQKLNLRMEKEYGKN